MGIAIAGLVSDARVLRYEERKNSFSRGRVNMFHDIESKLTN